MSFSDPLSSLWPRAGVASRSPHVGSGSLSAGSQAYAPGTLLAKPCPSPPCLIFKNRWTPRMSGYLLISSLPLSVRMTGFLLSTVLSAVFLKLQWTLGIGCISGFVIASFWIPFHFRGNYSLTSNCLGCLCFEFKSISLGTFLWFSESILLRLKSVWDK